MAFAPVTTKIPPSKATILKLYRECLKNSLKFDNYNFREYFLRKSRHEFRSAMNLKNDEEIIAKYNEGLKNFRVMKRQALISEQYKFDPIVVEKDHGNRRSNN